MTGTDPTPEPERATPTREAGEIDLAGLVQTVKHYLGPDWGTPEGFDHQQSFLVGAIHHLGGMKQDYVKLANRITQLDAANAALIARVEQDEGDARTLRGYISTYGETPAMTASNRDHWKRRVVAAEVQVQQLEAENETLRERVRALQAEPSDTFIRACLEGDRAALKAKVQQLEAANAALTAQVEQLEELAEANAERQTNHAFAHHQRAEAAEAERDRLRAEVRECERRAIRFAVGVSLDSFTRHDPAVRALLVDHNSGAILAAYQSQYATKELES